MLDYSKEFKSVIAITRVQSVNLCSRSTCWSSKGTEKCVKCSKRYCQGHLGNHFCTKKFEA